MIRKSSNGYTVYARTGRPMGTYRTREQAEVRLGQLEAFKAQRAPQMSPTVRPKRGGYYVRAKSGRNMGWYPTKAEALRRKGQLEANGAKFFKETRGYTRQASPNGQMGTQRGVVSRASRHPLPSSLHEAYEWTDAAGELDELRDAEGEDLLGYVAASVANAAEHTCADDEPISATALLALHEWLQEERDYRASR